jgi:hypothetical protein
MSRISGHLSGLLVVVPCGKAKIWDWNLRARPTAAADTYTGAQFTVNRKYAEQAGGDWVILSAKHGFLQPTDVVPGPYETTFKQRPPTRSGQQHCASRSSSWSWAGTTR